VNSSANFKILGLRADASWDEVKSAFRRLARTYHPDVAGPESARKFSEITEAYMILKESIAMGSSARRAPRQQAERGDLAQAQPAASGEAREPIFKAFWKKLSGAAKKGSHEKMSLDYDLPPVRVRFLGSVISRAESEMQGILSRRGEVKARSRTEAILRRLKSRHPSVVMLALQSISSRDATNDMRRAVVDHFARHTPSTEVLQSLLALFSAPSMSTDLARVLVAHSSGFSSSDSLLVLKWLRRQNAPKEFFVPFLSHPLDSVIAATLNGWPQGQSLPESADLLGLLKKDEESILVPLLRLMKKEKIPMWLMPSINKIMVEHKSPVVRVWASAIVRDQKLG
jgi:hypothetical protein